MPSGKFSAISITEVARRLGYKIERGMFRCHFPERHVNGDRTPSVSINEEKGYFKCFVCPDFKGDAIQLVRMTLGMGFREAVNWIGGERLPLAATPCAATPSLTPTAFSESQTRSRLQTNQELEASSSKILSDFLSILPQIDAHSSVAFYLAKRHIYKNAWDKAHLRFIDDYWRVSRELKNRHSVADLQNAGIFNEKGNLKYGKHPLIIPYIDKNHNYRFFQARAIDKNVIPKELNFKGSIPFPFNLEALDGKEGFVYVCEGAIDALTLLGKGFSAVGIPGAQSFKKEWTKLFKNKNVILCLDNDEAGRAGNARITAMLTAENINVRTFELPEGQDVNGWFLE